MMHEDEILQRLVHADLLPYFFTRYMKNSGSFCLTEMMAPTIEKEVAYQGPGNFDKG